MTARRRHRRQKAEETLSIVDDGSYTASDGTIHDISSSISHCIEAAKHYSGTDLDDLLFSSQQTQQPLTSVRTITTSFAVVNKTTIQAARELSTSLSSPGTDVALLNFASAKNPGGGFLNGARAQEESLAVSSALYHSLVQFEEAFYMHNSARQRRAMYSDNQIFSPQVPFFRDDDLSLVAPFHASVVTCPAVNYGALRSDDERRRAPEVMRTRMWKILHTIRREGCRHVVLGAYGCGVFGNPVRNVVEIFAELLLDGGPFENVFENVVFAVYDRDESRALRYFEQRFVG